MKKKYNDPDFCGMQAFGRTVEMSKLTVFLINLIITISPFGLLAQRKNDIGKIDFFATWFMRCFSAVCCYGWYSFIFG